MLLGMREVEYDIQINDDFDSGAITLAHDDAGNLTDDGVFLYVYDAWNRLVKVTRRLDAFTPVAEYEYDGLNRRIRKVVSNCGDGLVPGSDDLDGNGTPDATGIPFANRSEHYYYAGWRVIEERDNNGSAGRVLAQTVYGTEYIDEPVCRDRNIDVSTDSTPAADDCLDGSGGTTGSTRYFYHQDANYRVTAVTNESGTVVERYEYEAYGEPRVHVGQPAGGTYESGALVSTSYVGNPLMHQGLRRDDETGLHENRYRMLHSRLGRFMQRDPAGYTYGSNVYEDVLSDPLSFLDPLGWGPCDGLEAKLRTLTARATALALSIGRNEVTAAGLRATIANILADLADRESVLSRNPLGLPERPPYPGAPDWKSRDGHRKIIAGLRAALRSKEAVLDVVEKGIGRQRRELAELQAQIGTVSAELAACRAALKAGVKIVGKGAKLGVKAVPVVGWVVTIGSFGWDLTHGGFGHACNEAVWPLSELWVDDEPQPEPPTYGPGGVEA